MENATKALLIAAAVLVVIVIIALGVRLLSATGDTTGQAQTVSETTSVQTFNAQFSAYIGNKQSATALRTLKTAIAASNANNGNQVTQISVDPVEGKFYKIEATYGTDGRITSFTVTEL